MQRGGVMAEKSDADPSCHACAGSGLTMGVPPAVHVLHGPILSAPIETLVPCGHCPCCRGSGKAHVTWDVNGDGSDLRILSMATIEMARAVN